MKTQIDISIIIPLFNEAGSLKELAREIDNAIGCLYSYEVLFIDDGSTDDSWEVIQELSKKNYIKGIRLLRNFGKSKALQTGLYFAKGNLIATMDADLQDNPNILPKMIDKIYQGYDLVNGWKKNRKDSLSRRFSSITFNVVIRLISPLKLKDFNCGLKVFTSDVGKKIILRVGSHRHIPILAYWIGFTRIAEIEVPHRKRKYGKSRYGISRFWHGSIDIFFLMFLRRYVEHPIYFFGLIGAIFIIVGLSINIYLFILKFVFEQVIGHRPLIFLGILLLVTGIQLFCTGLVVELLLRQNDNQNHYEAIRTIINLQDTKYTSEDIKL